MGLQQRRVFKWEEKRDSARHFYYLRTPPSPTKSNCITGPHSVWEQHRVPLNPISGEAGYDSVRSTRTLASWQFLSREDGVSRVEELR